MHYVCSQIEQDGLPKEYSLDDHEVSRSQRMHASHIVMHACIVRSQAVLAKLECEVRFAGTGIVAYLVGSDQLLL